MPKVGQEYICAGCHKPGIYPDDLDEEFDRYGIYAGMYHLECWQKDPRRTWVFDPSYAGESLEEPD